MLQYSKQQAVCEIGRVWLAQWNRLDDEPGGYGREQTGLTGERGPVRRIRDVRKV